MDIRVIRVTSININFLVGRARRNEFQLFIGRHNSQTVFLYETRLHYSHSAAFSNFNLFGAAIHHLNQILAHFTRSTAILASDKFLTTQLFLPPNSLKSLKVTIDSIEATSGSIYVVSLYYPNQRFDPIDLSTIRSFC